MGGRGSSGIGSGTSLPALTGSEKQIAWASKIRTQALANADILIAQTKKPLGFTHSGTKISTSSAITAKKALQNTFQEVTSASKIIDTRGSVSFDSIVKVASIEQRTGEISKVLRNKKKRS